MLLLLFPQVVIVQRAVNRLARSGEALAAGDLTTVAATVTCVPLLCYSLRSTLLKHPLHDFSCSLPVSVVFRLCAKCCKTSSSTRRRCCVRVLKRSAADCLGSEV